MQESITESVPGTFITYQGSGVNYDVMDPFKIAAQRLAGLTASYCLQYGFQEESWSRGESAYVMRVVDPAKFTYLADVNEGLGTKSVIADDYHPSSDTVRPHFNISIDNFAMCVNDLLTTGALPLVCAMHLAVGSSDWFENEQKWMEILKGWSHACDITECVWGGGETPTLKRIITPGEVLLSGSASGVIRSPEDVIRESRIQDGDDIVLFESSGLHANGITMIWKDIIPKLPDGYNTLLSDGKEFGEALVAPTILYSPIIKALQDVGIVINYAVNITGHGWRKLMRAKRPFVYHIDTLPEPQPVFDFIQRMGPVEEQEMWGTYNMGAGFALYVDPDFTEEIINYAEKHCIRAWKAGRVEEDGGRKAVVIDNGRVVFAADTMNLRS